MPGSWTSCGSSWTGRPVSDDRRVPGRGAERDMLGNFLDYLRESVTLKVAGLSEEDIRRKLVPSLTTIGGLLLHLRWVEHYWFEHVLAGRPCGAPWGPADWDADFRLTGTDTLDALVADYARQCEVSRSLAWRYELDHESDDPHGGIVTVRWILLHLVEETARHAGHLDILREQIDGVTGR
ncbi:DinB family protein [Pseudonocardiaceae bacterium YIM PH 21723]|nr:DinB family protein [Pseudonocardiaceae bacterium YIM PH 21723]